MSLDVSNEQAVYYFHQGTNFDAQDFFGAHRIDDGRNNPAVFRVYAPNARRVSVVGDFNGWDASRGTMTRINDGGIFETTLENVAAFDCYKYEIESSAGIHLKADPYAFHAETRPGTASKFYDLSGFGWTDGDYMAKKSSPLDKPVNIYEVNLNSWRLHPDGNPFTYRELAGELPRYCREMGYTHLELMPITEYPFDGSWGYQCTGYFAPTARFGTPEDFMYFVDRAHAEGIGVILDWVPAHFNKDEHGLIEFDGGYCYEYSDPLKMEHEGWGTRVFDFGKPEVRSFLISSACFWLSAYHIDGLRVDAVASMLYLNYGREGKRWRKNANGGAENLEAVSFLQTLNTRVFALYPNALMCAEESTAWPLVTGEVSKGSLGFNLKWNMGWMNDLLSYMSLDPLFRPGSHSKLTFSMMYAFSENFILPLSHDEVVHGKYSLINKMPGDYAKKFANLRAFLAYMYAHPGKKLSFMGNELAQFIEWNYEREIDWLLLDYDMHKKFHDYARELHSIYLKTPSLWQIEKSWDGFEWLNADDASRSVIAFVRTDLNGKKLAVICNFSGADYPKYLVGMPKKGRWRVILDTSDARFGGACEGGYAVYEARGEPLLGFDASLSLNLRALTTIYLLAED